MEREIEIFVAIQCLVIGVSHIVTPKSWGRFFDWLRGKGDAGVFAVAFMSLWFGSIIVAFHNVWHGLPMMVTILGWGQLLKGAVYFCFPAVALRKMAMATEEKSRVFVYPGAALVLIGLAVALGLWGA